MTDDNPFRDVPFACDQPETDDWSPLDDLPCAHGYDADCDCGRSARYVIEREAVVHEPTLSDAEYAVCLWLGDFLFGPVF